VQYQRGGDQHDEQRGQRGRHPPVGRCAQQGQQQVPDPPRGAGRPGVRRVADLAADPGGAELVRGREQRHPVPGGHLVVAAGADHHVLVPGGQDRDRGQRAVQLPQAGAARGRGASGQEPLTVQRDLPGAGLQARLGDGRGGQARDVEHGHVDPGQGPADGGVGQLDDHPDVGSQLTGQQGRFQRLQVIFQDADHSGRAGQPRLGQHRSGPGAGLDVRDAPACELAGQGGIRVVVDDDGRDPGQVELLDDAQADAVQAAHDHVALPVRISAGHPGIIQVFYDADVSGAYAPDEDRRAAGWPLGAAARSNGWWFCQPGGRFG